MRHLSKALALGTFSWLVLCVYMSTAVYAEGDAAPPEPQTPSTVNVEVKLQAGDDLSKMKAQIESLEKEVKGLKPKDETTPKFAVPEEEIEEFVKLCKRPDKNDSTWNNGRHYEIVCVLLDTKGALWAWDTNDATAPDLSKSKSAGAVSSGAETAETETARADDPKHSNKFVGVTSCTQLDEAVRKFTALNLNPNRREAATKRQTRGNAIQETMSRILYSNSPIQVITLNCKDSAPILFSVNNSVYQGIAKLTDGSEETAVTSRAGNQELKSTSRHTTLPPQESGPLALVFTHGSKDEEKQHAFISYFVEQRYSGALRLGIGMSYAPNGTKASLIPLGQDHIVREMGSAPTLELMTLYTPFFYPRMRHRLYKDGNWFNRHFALTFGMGWLATDTDLKELKIVNSLNAGVDIEFNQFFSLQILGQLRRAEKLVPGVQNGDIVTSSDTNLILQQTIRPGVAVSMSFTPRFFNLRAAAWK